MTSFHGHFQHKFAQAKCEYGNFAKRVAVKRNVKEIQKRLARIAENRNSGEAAQLDELAAAMDEVELRRVELARQYDEAKKKGVKGSIQCSGSSSSKESGNGFGIVNKS